MVGTTRIAAAGGTIAMDAVLDALARVERASVQQPAHRALPAPAADCVLVTARSLNADSYADVFRADAETAL
jgi:hypothetical protein